MLGIKNYLVDIYDLSNNDNEKQEKLEKFPLSAFHADTALKKSFESPYFFLQRKIWVSTSRILTSRFVTVKVT